jgi:hypothetical protein
MADRDIVAEMWSGAEVIRAVDERAPPGDAELDAIAVSLTASNCGVKPTVRVVERFTWRAYEDSGEPVCEDLQAQRSWLRWRA